ncbi:hypothetical protein ACG92U_09930 [Leuconostoc citreum]
MSRQTRVHHGACVVSIVDFNNKLRLLTDVFGKNTTSGSASWASATD